MDKIARSFQLVAQSYGILMKDKELVVLPLLSGLVMVAVVASFVFGLRVYQMDFDAPVRTADYVALFLLYVVTYATGIFFQAAIVAGATERLRGGDPTVSSALAAAARRIVPILMWAVVAATVGVVLQAARERSGALGRIVAALLGVAWSLATFFIVPVLVLEDRSIKGSFTRSATVFRQNWGETLAGISGLGVAAFAAWVTLLLLFTGLTWISPLLAVVFFLCAAALLATMYSALQGIYVASLYRYATEGQAPAGFDAALLPQPQLEKTI